MKRRVITKFLRILDRFLIIKYLLWLNKYKNCPVTFVTASDSSHFKSLLNLLGSIKAHELGSRVIIYDLGFNGVELKTLRQSHPWVEIRRFCYEKYPSYFNVKVSAGQYAWKPIIIREIYSEVNSVVIWVDAGNILTGRLSLIRLVSSVKGLYLTSSSGLIKDWTHPKMCEYFRVGNNLLSHRNVNASVIGLGHKKYCKNLLDQWCECAKNKECIAPTGSNRENHRQDQAALTILTRINNIYRFLLFPLYGVKIHQDVD